jgi:hypothetical protein
LAHKRHASEIFPFLAFALSSHVTDLFAEKKKKTFILPQCTSSRTCLR